MTSAPRSAHRVQAKGAATTVAMSRMRTPAEGAGCEGCGSRAWPRWSGRQGSVSVFARGLVRTMSRFAQRNTPAHFVDSHHALQPTHHHHHTTQRDRHRPSRSRRPARPLDRSSVLDEPRARHRGAARIHGGGAAPGQSGDRRPHRAAQTHGLAADLHVDSAGLPRPSKRTCRNTGWAPACFRSAILCSRACGCASSPSR